MNLGGPLQKFVIYAMSLSSPQIDFEYWDRLISEAVEEPDPAISNFKITRCHYLLSMALQQLLGPDAGANFHSWAVWGSRKAGVTIRQEDLEEARRDGTVVGGIVGGIVGLGLGWFLIAWLTWGAVPAVELFGALSGAATGRYIIIRSRRISAALILEGNRTVLEDIGRQSARFITCFHAQCHPDAELFDRFIGEFRPGKTAAGGQELLRLAFTQYYQSRFAVAPQEKQEAAYLANCFAVFHEHIRLEPYIRGSLPWIVRRCVTKRLLQYDIGPIRLAVAHDVPSIDGVPFPASLRTFKNQELVAYLANAIGCEIKDNDTAGTGAMDWTKIHDRMCYIVNLFRAFHLEAVVFGDPGESPQIAKSNR